MAKRAVSEEKLREAEAAKAGKPKAPEETQIKIAKAWQEFRKSMLDFYANVSESVVDLAFDATIGSSTHFTFNAEEAVYLDNIKVSIDNKVIFTVPHGAKEKAFHYSDCELINTKTKDGVEKTLDSVVNDQFRNAFSAECPDVTSVRILERKYLQPFPELREALNDVETFLKEYEQNKNKGQIYAKIENYGLF